MEFLDNYPFWNGKYMLSSPKEGFEKNYLQVREKEGRLYSDEIVRQLPFPKASLRQQTEWQMRFKTASRMSRYLQTHLLKGNILDLGCGNGWLTNMLAGIPGFQVLGVDINERELSQAGRLFGKENCRFAYLDIFENALPENYFTYIILNSSVQYFPSFPALIRRLFLFLENRGEIHILDSPFYYKSDLADARKRSEKYYEKLGFGHMATHYHHHQWEDLDHFPHRVLYNPHSLLNRIRKKMGATDSPFPWICIVK